MRSPGVKWPESPRGCAPSTGRRGAGHRLPGHRAAVSRNTCSRHLRRGFHCRSWCSHCPFPFHKAASVNTAVCVQHPRLRLRQPPGLHLVVRGPAGSRGLFLALPLPAPPKASACPCESAPHSRCRSAKDWRLSLRSRCRSAKDWRLSLRSGRHSVKD